MKPSSPRIRAARSGVWFSLAAALLFAGGCQQVFVPKHKVLVDAIAAPEATKPAGMSYRLVAKRSMVSNTPVQIPILKACVDAALQGQGLYEPPPNTPPELIIEVSCGRDSSSRALAAVRETYLQLSARANPQRAVDKATGPELWDVRVAVLGLSGSIETALPLLSAVAAEHMATNTVNEMKVDVPQNAPWIESVRMAAIRGLETQAQRVAAAGNPGGAPETTTGTNSASRSSAQPAAAGSSPSSVRPASENSGAQNESSTEGTGVNPSVLREPVTATPAPEAPNPKAATSTTGVRPAGTGR